MSSTQVSISSTRPNKYEQETRTRRAENRTLRPSQRREDVRTSSPSVKDVTAAHDSVAEPPPRSRGDRSVCRRLSRSRRADCYRRASRRMRSLSRAGQRDRSLSRGILMVLMASAERSNPHGPAVSRLRRRNCSLVCRGRRGGRDGDWTAGDQAMVLRSRPYSRAVRARAGSRCCLRGRLVNSWLDKTPYWHPSHSGWRPGGLPSGRPLCRHRRGGHATRRECGPRRRGTHGEPGA